MENFFVVLFLVVLEGLLSFDNALVLAAMVAHLPTSQQRRALTYGIGGAFIFRVLAITLLVHILANPWVRIVGGGYLVWLAFSHFMHDNEVGPIVVPRSFWRTIILIEFADIVFSLDSILASVAVSQQIWVVVLGGCIGIIMMRFASMVFIKLINRWPDLEHSAYGLVALVGVKLMLEHFWKMPPPLFFILGIYFVILAFKPKL